MSFVVLHKKGHSLQAHWITFSGRNSDWWSFLHCIMRNVVLHEFSF